MFLEDFVEQIGDESRQFGRCVLQKFAWNRIVSACPVVVEPRKAVSIYVAVIGNQTTLASLQTRGCRVKLHRGIGI